MLPGHDEAEREVDHHEEPELRDDRPRAAVEHRVVDPRPGEEHADEPEDRPGGADAAAR